MASTSQIDWTVGASILRRKLRILSTKKLKQLCKSRNIQYSTDKLETIDRLVDANKTKTTNNKKAKTKTKHNKHIVNNTNQITIEPEEKKRQKVVLKIGILGDRQIGITTLMVKYIEDKYDEDYVETLGLNFMEKTLHLKNVDVTMSVWIPRGGRWHNHMQMVCSDAKVIIFAFDLTQKVSLFAVKRYYKEARKENKTFRPFLVGTKYDLYEEQNIDHKLDITKQARKYASKMRAPLIYCSCARSINVKRIFKLIVAKCFGLTPKMKEVTSVNEAIFEWTADRTKKNMICVVYGYIREIQKQFKWQYTMPIYDFANIILLFYGNIIIGGNNKEYKLEYKTHKKMQKKIRRMERKKIYEDKRKAETYTICVETETKENAS